MGDVTFWAVFIGALWCGASLVATVPLAFWLRGYALWLKALVAGIAPFFIAWLILLLSGEGFIFEDLNYFYLALCFAVAALLSRGLLWVLHNWFVRVSEAEGEG